VTPTVPSSPDATASTPSGPVVTPPDGQGPVADTTVSPDASTAATEPSLEAESSSIIYKVKAHDTLARIAHRYHLTRAKLMAANGLKSERVKPGQRLTIPVRSVAAAAKPEESSGPNLTLLGDSIPDDAAKPVASTMHEKTMMTSSTGGHHTYTVVKGDTLSRIARRFHTSTNAILALNGAIDARKLRIGQKLRIPSRESRSASAAPVASPVAIPVQPDNDRIEPRATPSPQLANFMP
jgi:LysM repeat protein